MSVPDDPDVYSEILVSAEPEENPFCLSNLQNAIDAMCKGATYTLQPTHHVIKFTFADTDTLYYKELVTQTEFSVYDYPIHHTILQMGDYYNVNESSSLFPNMYALVEVGTDIGANYTYSIEESYDFYFGDLYVLRKSFELVGKHEIFNEYLRLIEPDINLFSICGGDIPEIEPCPPNCIAVAYEDANGIILWDCHCLDTGGGSGPGGGADPLNECGCPISTHPMGLTGCLTVDDLDEEGNEITDGVDNVEILISEKISLNGFGFPIHVYNHKVSTDENGCWRLNRRVSGNVQIKVRFRNDDSYLRKPWQELFKMLQPLEDYIGQFGEQDYANINHNYDNWNNVNQGGERHINWAAATVNNGIQEFIDMTTDIAPPPPLLDVLLMPSRRDGAALLLHISPIAPDLSIGINRINPFNMDQLVYHEMAHASHFTYVGNNWWSTLFWQEFQNAQGMDPWFFTFEGSPYGEGDEPAAGYVALAEGWAESLSDQLTDIPLENSVYWWVDGEETHIPLGLFNDLMDNTPNEIIPGTIVFDRIAGYTRARMFEALNDQAIDLETYRQNLLTTLPQGNDPHELQNLITVYTQ